MSKAKGLDTNTVIRSLNRSITLDVYDGGQFFISVITELELYSKRGMTQAEEADVRNFIAKNTKVIELNPEIKKTTIAIRRASTLKLPDAIIAATAIVLNATVLSNDPHLVNFTWPGYAVELI